MTTGTQRHLSRFSIGAAVVSSLGGGIGGLIWYSRLGSSIALYPTTTILSCAAIVAFGYKFFRRVDYSANLVAPQASEENPIVPLRLAAKSKNGSHHQLQKKLVIIMIFQLYTFAKKIAQLTAKNHNMGQKIAYLQNNQRTFTKKWQQTHRAYHAAIETNQELSNQQQKTVEQLQSAQQKIHRYEAKVRELSKNLALPTPEKSLAYIYPLIVGREADKKARAQQYSVALTQVDIYKNIDPVLAFAYMEQALLNCGMFQKNKTLEGLYEKFSAVLSKASERGYYEGAVHCLLRLPPIEAIPSSVCSKTLLNALPKLYATAVNLFIRNQLSFKEVNKVRKKARLLFAKTMNPHTQNNKMLVYQFKQKLAYQQNFPDIHQDIQALLASQDAKSAQLTASASSHEIQQTTSARPNNVKRR